MSSIRGYQEIRYLLVLLKTRHSLGVVKGYIIYEGLSRNTSFIDSFQGIRHLLGVVKGYIIYWGLSRDALFIKNCQGIHHLLGVFKGYVIYELSSDAPFIRCYQVIHLFGVDT